MSFHYLLMAPKKNITQSPIALNLKAGFGLIELMVSIGIMVLVMSSIMVKQNAFDGAAVLRNQTYEIALTIREMQLSAVSSIATSSADGSSGNYRNTYGLRFDQVDLPNHYEIWQDENNNHVYDSGVDSLVGKQGSIDPRFMVKSIKRLDTDPDLLIDDINISFKRPNFDAIFRRDNGDPISEGVEIVIALKRDDNVSYTIEITQAGQINITQ